MQRQPQARRRGEPAPRVVVEEGLGHGPARELGVLQPAHEDRAEAPRADLERVGEQHALGGVALAHLDRRERLQHVLRAAQQRGVGGGEPAQLAGRRPQLGGDARLVALRGIEQVRAADVRRGPDRVRLGDERREQRLRAGARGVRQRVEPCHDLRRPARRGVAGARDLMAAHLRVELVRQVGRATAVTRPPAGKRQR